MPRSWTLLLLLVLLVAISEPVASAAQTIPLRTVPVASGDQFRMLPSATMGMGGVRLAVDDSLADGWSNPAKGSLVRESAFFGSPTYYSMSNRGGAGRTFPVAGLFSGTAWFGGGALALQQIEDDDGRGDAFFAVPAVDGSSSIAPCCWGCCGPSVVTLSEQYGRNVYADAFVGRRLPGSWSLGLGVSGARLGAMDGVDLLYAGSERIDQAGALSDVRVGLFRSGALDRLSFLVLHNRVSMTHEVSYTEWFWDPLVMNGQLRHRVEVHEDQTRTWGGEVAWDRALSAPGWRVGASATVNYKDHPKIPNYALQNIPRDPGTTWAYEAAFGFARTDDNTTFALDLALQPIWSETWQEADALDVAASGQRLSLGDRSIENDFFFTNVVINTGLSHRAGRIEAQAGLEIRSYDYQLEQVNHVQVAYREQNESWIEWSPTLGALFRFEALDLRYAARVTTGTGRPGTAGTMVGIWPAGEAARGDFILAPEGPITLQPTKVTTHQLSVRIPIR